ncbi:MAG TPA: hypothetical protein VJ184_06085, partial [Chryseolinea sp.]|nr:hypothetical protein [Chryseolinea sp.]
AQWLYASLFKSSHEKGRFIFISSSYFNLRRDISACIYTSHSRKPAKTGLYVRFRAKYTTSCFTSYDPLRAVRNPPPTWSHQQQLSIQ